MMFFKLAFQTCIRLDALITLTWEQIKQEYDRKTKENIWVIVTWDKGKDNIKAIPESLYNELVKLKEENTGDKLFEINSKTLGKTLKRFCKDNGIKEDRNLVIHSLKKTGEDFVFEVTGDIIKTAQAGNHSSIEMEYQHYLGQNNSFASQTSYSLFNDNLVNKDVLDNWSKEELLKAIKKCRPFVISEIISKGRD
jgi:integrase